MLLLLFIPFLVIIDQIVKKLCPVELANEPITLIPHIVELTYLENRGAAFGIMKDVKIFLILLPIIIILGLIFYYIKLGNNKFDKINKVALVLIISGAIGNLIDRASKGYVIDMFNFTFIDFPVFNVADIYVVVGAFILIISTFLFSEE